MSNVQSFKTIVFFQDGTSAELLGDDGQWVTVQYKSGIVADRLASQITDRFEVANSASNAHNG